jgi:hypothetical protein
MRVVALAAAMGREYRDMGSDAGGVVGMRKKN